MGKENQPEQIQKIKGDRKDIAAAIEDKTEELKRSRIISPEDVLTQQPPIVKS